MAYVHHVGFEQTNKSHILSLYFSFSFRIIYFILFWRKICYNNLQLHVFTWKCITRTSWMRQYRVFLKSCRKYLNILMVLLERCLCVVHYVNLYMLQIVFGLALFIIWNKWVSIFACLPFLMHFGCVFYMPYLVSPAKVSLCAYQVYTQSTTQFICVFACAQYPAAVFRGKDAIMLLPLSFSVLTCIYL